VLESYASLAKVKVNLDEMELETVQDKLDEPSFGSKVLGVEDNIYLSRIDVLFRLVHLKCPYFPSGCVCNTWR